MKLDVKAFVVTCALTWGLGLFATTWWIMLFDGATGDATFLGRVYRGYSITPIGSLIGLAYALLDGLIAGAIIAWVYNRIAARISPKES